MDTHPGCVLAVISDIHGNLPALQAVLADIANRAVDRVINLGDHLSGPLWPSETARFLRKQRDWVHILGNHDKNLFALPEKDLNPSDAQTRTALTQADIHWLKTLTPIHMLTPEIVSFHGGYADDTAYLLQRVEKGKVREATDEEIRRSLPDYPWELVLCGHTHLPGIRSLSPGPLVVNPGSVGLQAYDDDQPDYHVMATGSPEARYAIVERRQNRWAATIIKVAYDHQKAAARAAENHRPDWETALLTGTLP